MLFHKHTWLLMTALALMPCAHATSIDKVGTQQLVKDAQLIFNGVVTKVAYRNTDVASSGDLPVPHTFVTFAIDQSMKGASASGNTITLRFEGGPDGKGNTMLVPGIPLFDVGDQATLFVKGNGKFPCPLVGCEQGRFHVVGDAVYNNEGQEVWLSKKGELVYGPHHAIKSITSKTVGDRVFEFGTAESKAKWMPPKGSNALNAASFTSFLMQKVAQTHTAKTLASVPAVADTNIRDSFVMTGVKAEAPPSPPKNARVANAAQALSSDSLEENMLKQSGGDPTFGSSSQ